MAKMVQTTFVVTVSKLVKDDQPHDQVLNADQTHMILHMLPGVVEEVLATSGVVVEAHTLSD